MKSHFVTFGQRYRTHPHPVDPRCSPDGYVRIKNATSDEDAQNQAMKAFGPYWSMVYNAPPSALIYPKGELFAI